MTDFPLLRLPFLPLKDVLKMMDPVVRTLLFACCKKARNIIRATKKEVCYHLLSFEQKKSLNALEILHFFRFEVQIKPFVDGRFKVANTIEIQLHLKDNPTKLPLSDFSIHVVFIDEYYRYKGTKGNLEIDGINIPVILTDKQTLYTFWKCLYEGFSILDSYIQKAIHFRFEDYTICGSDEPKSSQYLKAAVQWMAQQSRIDFCNVNKVELISDDDYKNILDNVNPELGFYHSGERSEKFQHATNIKSRYLSLNYASWFTINNLLNTESKRIGLYKSKLTNDDMKEFLKHWVNGRFPKLEKLTVEMENQIDLDLILTVLPGYTSERDIKRDGYVLNRIGNRIRITLQNGFIATIHKDKERFFEMTVRLK